ncbi:cytochrome b5 [Microstroma glucosiphilum]|uniref:Cytochrome b5 n=1 Tax=Pseudomicrostroma glucosiphilum TaxID=1684307 RepID=A0A316UIZ7_9BASI|nr:cytochrome b5 [Pseudomicrostroma glucosiphilum]PWN23175.1 cytochrome b5 [Pseudomicrostroma glucosiphilum]
MPSSPSSTPPAEETTASSSAVSPDTTAAEARPRQVDPSDPSRTVAYKKANTPFLAHARFKAQEAERRREKRRQKGLPEDGDEEEEPLELPGPRTVLKWMLLILIAVLAMGQFVTGDVLYGYKGKWRNPKKWIPVRQRVFTPAELAMYDGTEPSRPIYLAVMGNVYDVTKGSSTYKPGGSYSFFAGKDASRAYTTGCFKTHLTHDLRGLSEDQVEQVRGWDTFFANNPKYFKVGTVRTPAINPSAPIPEPC